MDTWIFVMAAFQHYEPRFWGLDPVFSTRVRLNIIDVLSLQPHPTIPGTRSFTLPIIRYSLHHRSVLYFEPSCSERTRHGRLSVHPKEIKNDQVRR